MLRRMAKGWRSVNPPNKRDCGIARERFSSWREKITVTLVIRTIKSNGITFVA